MVTYMCPVRECKRGRTFHAAGRTFTFRDCREEGMMSIRASEIRQSFRMEIKGRETLQPLVNFMYLVIVNICEQRKQKLN